MTYKAQYLVPINVEFDAEDDVDAIRIADEMALSTIMRTGEAQYPDLGYHAIIDANGRTVDET